MKKIMLKLLVVSMFIMSFSGAEIKAANKSYTIESSEKIDYFNGKLRSSALPGDKIDLMIEIENKSYAVYNIDNLDEIYFVKMPLRYNFFSIRPTANCFPGDYGYPYCTGNFPQPVSDPRANERFVACLLRKTFGGIPQDLSIATIVAIIKKMGRDEAIKYIISSPFGGGVTYVAVKLIWDSTACIICNGYC